MFGAKQASCPNGTLSFRADALTPLRFAPGASLLFYLSEIGGFMADRKATQARSANSGPVGARDRQALVRMVARDLLYYWHICYTIGTVNSCGGFAMGDKTQVRASVGQNAGMTLLEIMIGVIIFMVVLGATAQATLIHCLLHGHGEPINPSMLAARMGYTAMTATRVIREFTAAELGREHAEGRKRWFVFGAEKPVIWERARPLLRSPVKRRVHALRTQGIGGVGWRAGLSALAQVTMLTEPGTETRAITTAEAHRFGALAAAQKIVDSGPDILRFEVWNYDPHPLATGKNGRVDPLSLYLSLQDDHDERVEAALAQMMSALAW